MFNISVEEGAVGARAGAASPYGSAPTKSLRLRYTDEGIIIIKKRKKNYIGKKSLSI
jgi:hypothetical protein